MSDFPNDYVSFVRRHVTVSVDTLPPIGGSTFQSLFFGIDPKEIGKVGAGKRKPNGKLDVVMIQSLVRRGSVEDLVACYGQGIVDECHHLPAVSFERVRDGYHPIAQMQLGPVRFSVDAKSQAADRPVQGHASSVLLVRARRLG